MLHGEDRTGLGLPWNQQIQPTATQANHTCKNQSGAGGTASNREKPTKQERRSHKAKPGNTQIMHATTDVTHAHSGGILTKCITREWRTPIGFCVPHQRMPRLAMRFTITCLHRAG